MNFTLVFIQILVNVMLIKADPPVSTFAENSPPSSQYLDYSSNIGNSMDSMQNAGYPTSNSAYGYGHSSGSNYGSQPSSYGYDYSQPSSHYGYGQSSKSTLNSPYYGNSVSYSPSVSTYNHYSNNNPSYGYPQAQSSSYGYDNPDSQFQNFGVSNFEKPSYEDEPQYSYGYDRYTSSNGNQNYGTQTTSYSPFRTFYESENRDNSYGSGISQPSSEQSFHPSSPSFHPTNYNQFDYKNPGGNVGTNTNYNFDISQPQAYKTLQSTATFVSKPETSYDSFYTAEPLSPSYAPPRSFLKSMLRGITSTIAASLKPTFGFDEPWKPVDHPSPPAATFHQDIPRVNEAPKQVKHIYIHSSTNKFPEEVNLRLILIKPKALHEEGYNSLLIYIYILVGRQLSTSPPLFPISDAKRSKINAQLYFVRFKSPLQTQMNQYRYDSIRATPIHDFSSKRNLEVEKVENKKSISN